MDVFLGWEEKQTGMSSMAPVFTVSGFLSLPSTTVEGILTVLLPEEWSLSQYIQPVKSWLEKMGMKAEVEPSELHYMVSTQWTVLSGQLAIPFKGFKSISFVVMIRMGKSLGEPAQFLFLVDVEVDDIAAVGDALIGAASSVAGGTEVGSFSKTLLSGASGRLSIKFESCTVADKDGAEGCVADVLGVKEAEGSPVIQGDMRAHWNSLMSETSAADTSGETTDRYPDNAEKKKTRSSSGGLFLSSKGKVPDQCDEIDLACQVVKFVGVKGWSTNIELTCSDFSDFSIGNCAIRGGISPDPPLVWDLPGDPDTFPWKTWMSTGEPPF